MDNEKIAQFISSLRKSKKMTQKELANQLGITDKAVSKWERGLSCPDISLLPALSDILGISVNELLNGKRLDTTIPEADTIIETTFQYADTATKNKSKNIRLLFTAAFSSISLLGIIVCAICNLAISKNLTWALFPISSIIFAWTIITPAIIWGRKGILISLLLFSVLIIPFLFVLEQIIGIKDLILSMGTRISAVSLIYLWEIFFLFYIKRLRVYGAASFAVLSGIPFSFGIQSIVSKFTKEPLVDIWDVLSYSILIFTFIIIFVYGYMKYKKITK